jgi:hypothetical protein
VLSSWAHYYLPKDCAAWSYICTLTYTLLYRFHSFYPWHAGGDYTHLCNEKDYKMLHWVREFK